MSTALYTHPDHLGFRIDEGDTHALLIPGFMGTPAEMRPLARALADAGVSVRAMLLPGFGPDAASMSRVSADQWVEVAAQAWREERARARRSVLLGFSMGGAIAATVAAEAGTPDALILLAPHIRIADRRAVVLPVLKHILREFQPFANADFSDPGIRTIFSEMAPGADLDDPATQAMLRKQTAIPTRTLDELRRTGVFANRAAARIAAPTLIVQGEQDLTSLPVYSREFGERVAGPVDYQPVPGAHMLVDPLHPGWELTTRAVVRHATGEAGR
jgi:carboxylesterase